MEAVQHSWVEGEGSKVYDVLAVVKRGVVTKYSQNTIRY